MCDFSETLERLYTKTEAVQIFIKEQFFIVKILKIILKITLKLCQK